MKTMKIYPVTLALVCSLAATLKAQNLYVGTGGTIGEYGLDGSTVNESLITGPISPVGIAFSGNDLFVANRENGTIAEYTTSGATVNADLISGLSAPGVSRFQETTCLSRILAPVPSVNMGWTARWSMPRWFPG